MYREKHLKDRYYYYHHVEDEEVPADELLQESDAADEEINFVSGCCSLKTQHVNCVCFGSRRQQSDTLVFTSN